MNAGRAVSVTMWFVVNANRKVRKFRRVLWD